MPLFDYMCQCGAVTEEYIRPGEQRPLVLSCEQCQGTAHLVTAICIARTAGRWGDSKAEYIPALGGHIANSMEFDKACEEKGLVPFDDVGRANVQSVMDKNRRGQETAEGLIAEVEQRAHDLDGNNPDDTAKALALAEVVTPQRFEEIEAHGDR